VADATRAVLVTEPLTEGSTRAVTVTVAEAPAARVPSEQTVSPPCGEQDPADGVADVMVRLLSGLSVMATLATSDGPALLAVSR
jgi:hypothetical protein